MGQVKFPKMDKALIIKTFANSCQDDKKKDCIDLAMTHYPFANNSTSKRQYSRYQMCRVFLRDGFIDRCSGDKLLFLGIIMLLSFEFPEIFKYHTNWKMSEISMVYQELFTTIDHFVPVARGGKDEESNWITTSMVLNSAKSNWTIEELGWKLYNKGELEVWDGLINCFLELTNKNPLYEKGNYISELKKALLKAKNTMSNQ